MQCCNFEGPPRPLAFSQKNIFQLQEFRFNKINHKKNKSMSTKSNKNDSYTALKNEKVNCRSSDSNMFLL